jgi:hypothetical protein
MRCRNTTITAISAIGTIRAEAQAVKLVARRLVDKDGEVRQTAAATLGQLGAPGSMLPFVLREFGLNPASASAPFVATLVDVTGLVIYFTIASFIMLKPGD